jgi:hypothetical protein
MNLAIITPNPHLVTDRFAESLALTFRDVHEAGGSVRWIRGACSEISIGRNALLAQFLHTATEGEIAVFIDSDIGWDYVDLQIITEPIEQGELDVVAGVYPFKRTPLVPTGLQFLPEHLSASGYGGSVRGRGKYLYVEAKRVAGGFTALSQRALRKVIERVPAYAPPNASFGPGPHHWLFGSGIDDKGQAVTEDHHACDELRKAGIAIWASLDAAPCHILGGMQFGKHAQPLAILDFARLVGKRDQP